MGGRVTELAPLDPALGGWGGRGGGALTISSRGLLQPQLFSSSVNITGAPLLFNFLPPSLVSFLYQPLHDSG